jgi:hypothetical protein
MITRNAILAISAVVGLLCCLSVTCATGDVSSHHGWSSAVQGSGVIRSEARDTGPFSGVQLRDSLDVEIVIGTPAQVTIEADDNLLPLIDTRVDDGRLIIESHGSYRMRHRGVVHIQTPALREVLLDGSGDVDIQNLDSDALKLVVAGSGDIRAGGRVARLDARIEGSGDLRLASLAASDARVRIDGSGDAEVRSAGLLDAVVNGSGDIVYHGQPAQIDRRVNGSGSIRSE